MAAAVMAASMMAVSASAATTKLLDVVHPDEEDAKINDAYYSIGGMGFFMNNKWEGWNQGDWCGIDDEGKISIEYEISDILADKSMSGEGSLGFMGLMVCNLPDNYPYAIKVLEATFTDPEGKVTELDTIKDVTVAEEFPIEGNLRLLVAPNDVIDEKTETLKAKAAPEVAGWDEAGKFNGGTLKITVDFNVEPTDDGSEADPAPAEEEKKDDPAPAEEKKSDDKPAKTGAAATGAVAAAAVAAAAIVACKKRK